MKQFRTLGHKSFSNFASKNLDICKKIILFCSLFCNICFVFMLDLKCDRCDLTFKSVRIRSVFDTLLTFFTLFLHLERCKCNVTFHQDSREYSKREAGKCTVEFVNGHISFFLTFFKLHQSLRIAFGPHLWYKNIGSQSFEPRKN